MKDDEAPLGEFALATYHCYSHVELHFVYNDQGRPAPDWNPCAMVHQAYRWNSYHAAAKFKRENPEVAGYIIVNLREIKEQCKNQGRIEDAIHEAKAAAAQRKEDANV